MSWSLLLKSLPALYVFALLSVGSVESYDCTERECYNGRCSLYSKTCESSNGCFDRLQEIRELTPPIRIDVLNEKGCSEDPCTELAFSATIGNNITFRYGHRCCYMEQCNRQHVHGSNDPPASASEVGVAGSTVSLQSSQPNGVECPACYNETGQCATTTTLKCKGAEKKCVDVTGTDKAGRVIHGMGCATQTACNLKNVTILGYLNIDTSCTNGSSTLRSFSSVLTSLFLIKVFL